MQQFAALGYIEDPSADKEKMAKSAEIEAKYNLAHSFSGKVGTEQARRCSKKSLGGGLGKIVF